MQSLRICWRWPLRLKIVLLLFVSSVLPLAILGFIECHYERVAVLQSTSALLTARGDEVEGKLDAFHTLYQRDSERIARTPDIVQYMQSSSGARAPFWINGKKSMQISAVSPSLMRQAPSFLGQKSPWSAATSRITGSSRRCSMGSPSSLTSTFQARKPVLLRRSRISPQ